MGTVHFEDLEVGASFTSEEVAADREEMLDYSRLNDPWPFHVDEAAAAQTSFGGLIASGGYSITLMYRLGHRIYNQPGGRWAMLGALEWRLAFPAPLRPGERVRLRLTVKDKRESSRPGRGHVRLLYELLNQDGVVVLSVLNAALIGRRPRN